MIMSCNIPLDDWSFLLHVQVALRSTVNMNIATWLSNSFGGIWASQCASRSEHNEGKMQSSSKHAGSNDSEVTVVGGWPNWFFNFPRLHVKLKSCTVFWTTCNGLFLCIFNFCRSVAASTTLCYGIREPQASSTSNSVLETRSSSNTSPLGSLPQFVENLFGRKRTLKMFMMIWTWRTVKTRWRIRLFFEEHRRLTSPKQTKAKLEEAGKVDNFT